MSLYKDLPDYDPDHTMYPKGCYETTIKLRHPQGYYRFLKVGESPIKGDQIEGLDGKWKDIQDDDLDVGEVRSDDPPMRRKL